ncbi:hypothetical protein [Streptomyces olivaceiscleroticus]
MRGLIAPSSGHRSSPGAVAHDREWTGDRRDAWLCSLTLLGLLLLLDGASGRLTPLRAALWAGLAVLLFIVLLPPRVTAGEGWLATCGLLHERRIRTDCLVSVRCLDGVGQRLVLRDLNGTRAELDPKVLIANPDIWRLLQAGARTSSERGLLTCGAGVLRQLSRRIDSEAAHLVFKASGLE